MLLADISGKRIGDFLVDERIGRGGMATVYRALQLSVNRYVALKVISLNPHSLDREEFQQRFAQEASVIAMLEHLHILPLYSYGIVEDECAYLAMRLLRGGSLGDLLRGERMTLDRIATIFQQVSSALDYAHQKNVIHRDIKPTNILFDDAGNAYLSDFGLAKFTDSSQELTRTGRLVGTPTYIAPEIVLGKPASAQSDIYGMGVILYHMLAGRPPFELGDSGVHGLLIQHVERLPPLLREFNAEVTPQVEAVVMRALQKAPEDRYASAMEMADDLNTALGRLRPRYRSTLEHRGYNTRRWMRSRIRRVNPSVRIGLLIMVVMMAGIILGGALFAQENRPVRWDGSSLMIADASGTLEEVTPTQGDIDGVRAALGSSGFIAYIACSLDSNFQMLRAEELRTMSDEMGLPYRLYNSNSSLYDQLLAIERARTENARAIILCALDSSLLMAAIDSMQQAQLPLIMTVPFDHPYGIKVSPDNTRVGEMMGTYAAQIVNEELGGHADVLLLDNPDLAGVQVRIDSALNWLRRLTNGVEITARLPGGFQEPAQESVRQALADQTPDLIVSITDSGARGAIAALEAAGIPPSEVGIISANADPLIVDYVERGYYVRATVDSNRALGSRLALYAAIRLLSGHPVPERLIHEPGQLITRESFRQVTPTAGS